MSTAGESATVSAPPVAAPPRPGPYPGLRPFEEADGAIFFGRQKQVAALLHKLERSRFVAVVGSSGSGKSSLVKAGLFPAIRSQFLLDSEQWMTVTMRPGRSPYGNLLSAIRRSLGEAGVPPMDEAGASAFGEKLRRTDTGLLKAIQAQSLGGDRNILLVADQFEELFAFRRGNADADSYASRREAASFVSMLLASCREPDSRVWVLLTMRSDFIGDCEAFLGLPEQVSQSQFLVPRLDFEQMRDAIVRPSLLTTEAYQPFTVPEELVSLIIGEAGDRPDQLPLMQHALMRTWKFAVERAQKTSGPILLKMVDYERAGRIENALSQHAEEAWRRLKKDARKAELCRTMFLLVCDVSREGRIVRQRPRVSDVQEVTGASLAEIQEIVRAFQDDDRNFLLPPADEPLQSTDSLDVTHEALLRQWTTYRRWQVAERERVSELRRLVEQASLVAEGTGGKLHGKNLDRVLSWRKQVSQKWAELHGVGEGEWKSVLGLIDESDADEKKRKETEAKKAAEAERKEADAAKKEADAVRKETDAARKDLEAARKEAEAARKVAMAVEKERRMKALIWWLGVALLGLSVLASGVTAYYVLWAQATIREGIISAAKTAKEEQKAQAAREAADVARKFADESFAKSVKEQNEAKAQIAEAVKQQVVRFVDAIGQYPSGELSVGEGNVLRDLAGLPTERESVRRAVLDTWVTSSDSVRKPLARDAAGFHAALGISAARREATRLPALRLTGEAIGIFSGSDWLDSLGMVMDAKGLELASGMMIEVMENPSASDSERAHRAFLAKSLGMLARQLPPAKAEALAKQVATLMDYDMDERAKMDFGDALADLTDVLPPEVAAEPAFRGVAGLAGMFRSTSWRLKPWDPANARYRATKRLARLVPPAQAAALTADLARRVALLAPAGAPQSRLVDCCAVIVNLAPGLTPTQAAEPAASLAKSLENCTDPELLLPLAAALAAVTRRLEPASAAAIVDPRATTLLGLLLDAEKAARGHTPWLPVAGGEANPLDNLRDALGELAPQLNPKQAAILADRLVKEMEGLREDPICQIKLAQAVAKVTRSFKSEEVSAPAERAADLLCALIEREENLPDDFEAYTIRHSTPNVGVVLGELAGNIRPQTARALADRLVAVMERLRPSSLLAAIGRGLGALTERLNPADAADRAQRGATILMRMMPDGDLSISFGGVLARLSAQLPPAKRNEFLTRAAQIVFADVCGSVLKGKPSDIHGQFVLLELSMRLPELKQTPLFALGRVLQIAPPFGKSGLSDEDRAQEDRAQVAEYLDSLPVLQLATILKWPTCGDEWQQLILAAIEKRTGLKFQGILANFIAAADAEKVPEVKREFLDTPATFPSQDAVSEELRALQTVTPSQP